MYTCYKRNSLKEREQKPKGRMEVKDLRRMDLARLLEERRVVGNGGCQEVWDRERRDVEWQENKKKINESKFVLVESGQGWKARMEALRKSTSNDKANPNPTDLHPSHHLPRSVRSVIQ